MTPQEFESALAALGWKQADFCRKTNIERSTPRRWLSGATAIPGWVPSYLAAMHEIQRLYDTFIRPAPVGMETAESDAEG